MRAWTGRMGIAVGNSAQVLPICWEGVDGTIPWGYVGVIGRQGGETTAPLLPEDTLGDEGEGITSTPRQRTAEQAWAR